LSFNTPFIQIPCKLLDGALEFSIYLRLELDNFNADNDSHFTAVLCFADKFSEYLMYIGSFMSIERNKVVADPLKRVPTNDKELITSNALAYRNELDNIYRIITNGETLFSQC
jgi:hypothetical protein